MPPSFFADRFGAFLAPSERTPITIDLWHRGRWTQEELDSFVDLLGTLGRAEGQRSAGARGFGLQVAIEFATVAIAASFLKELGTDLYRTFREKFIDLLSKRKQQHLLEQRSDPEKHDLLTLLFPTDTTDSEYSLWYRSDGDLEGIFDLLLAVDREVTRFMKSEDLIAALVQVNISFDGDSPRCAISLQSAYPDPNHEARDGPIRSGRFRVGHASPRFSAIIHQDPIDGVITAKWKSRDDA